MLKKYMFFVLILFFPLICWSDCQCFNLLSGPYRTGIGPEIYSTERTTDDRCYTGWLAGERTFFDRIRPWCIYYGIDQYYAAGCLERRNSLCCYDCVDEEEEFCKQKLGPKTLHVSDTEVEGRLGFTIQSSSAISFDFTPFLGLGYYLGKTRFWKECYRENNLSTCIKEKILNFDDPCECCQIPFRCPKKTCKIKYELRPNLHYFSTGFLSRFYLCESASIGVNFKMKCITHGCTRITVDISKKKKEKKQEEMECEERECCFKFFEDILQNTMYEVDVPITYNSCGCYEQNFELSVVPFYRTRVYDYKECSPLNDTKFKIWGGRFMITYLF